MSWEADFNSQWQTLIDVTETEVRRRIGRGRGLDLQSANVILQRYVGNWFNTSHYNCAWLRKLRREDPIVGAEVEATLKVVRLQTPVTLGTVCPIRYGLAVAAVATAVFLGTLWQGEPMVRQVLAVGLSVLITIPLAAGTWGRQQRREADRLVARLGRELMEVGRAISEVVAAADRHTIGVESNHHLR